MNKDEVINRARSMVDVPFTHLGRNKHGLDCIGLLAYAHDYPASKLPLYPRDPLNGQLELHLTKILGPPRLIAPFNVEELQAGDIAAMQYKGPVRHVGIIADHPTLKGQLSLIHTDSALGYVTEHILDAKWVRRIKKVWR